MINVLYFHTGIFRSVCAVPNVTVSSTSQTSCFPYTLLRCFLNDSEIVTIAAIITGIIFIIIIIIIISVLCCLCNWHLCR
jgi:hypothetical protein